MGASAAAAIAVKERHIVEAFRRAGATNPEADVTLGLPGVEGRVASHRLRRRVGLAMVLIVVFMGIFAWVQTH